MDAERFSKDWWWLPASLVLAVFLGSTLGYTVPLVVYAILNGLGVWTFLPGSRSTPTRLDTTVRALAAVLMPVGFLVLFPKSAGPREIAPGEVPPAGGAPGHGVGGFDY